MISTLLLGALFALAAQEPPAEEPAPEAAQEPAAPAPAPSEAPRQQQPQPPDPGPDDPAAGASAQGPLPSLLDSVQLIVNDACITTGDLARQAAQEGRSISTREEYFRILEQSAEKLIRSKLMQQAGRDLGYEEQMIRTMVREELERQTEAAGSVTALAQELDRFAVDSLDLKETTEEKIYQSLWQGSVTGKWQGPGGRPYVDRYVRPGQLRAEYIRQGANLELPTKVQMEELIVAPSLGDTIESARQKAQLVRSRLDNGEDFYELNATYGIPGREPELDPIEEQALAAMPDVAAFVAGAEPGDISEVLPITRSGQVAGFRILRFVSRQEGKVTSFVDREYQVQLTRSIQGRRDEASQERALLRLLEAAFVWPPELGLQSARGPQEPAPAAAPQPGPEEAPQGAGSEEAAGRS